MGPFFYSKYEIPANSLLINNLSLPRFFLDIPPKATISFLVYFEISLNLLIPKKFLFFLKIDEIKILFTFCISLILISLRLCADPINSNFFLNEKARCLVFLLNDGIYAPFKSSLFASFILLDK